MLRKMLIKSSWFDIPFTSIYPRDIIWQIMKLIIDRLCTFPYNDDNVVFTGIFCIRNITLFKMGDGVSTFL